MGDFLKNNSDVFHVKWFFHRIGCKESTLVVEKDLIENEDLDFLTLVSDFYAIEWMKRIGIENEEKIRNLSKQAKTYRVLLQLKYIYLQETIDCINKVENSEIDFPCFNLNNKKIFMKPEAFSEFWECFIRKYPEGYLERYAILDILINTICEVMMGKVKCDYLDFKNKLSSFYEDSSSIKLRNNLSSENIYQLIEQHPNILRDLIMKEENKWQFLEVLKKRFENNVSKFNLILEQFELKGYFKFISTEDVISLKLYAFEKLSDLFSNEIQSRKKMRKKIKCFAVLTIGNKNFFTFNGVNDNKLDSNSYIMKAIEIIKDLVQDDSYQYMSVNNDCRYYIKKRKYITYHCFKNFGSIQKKTYYNRMFTCCERKLLVSVHNSEEQNVNNPQLFVTKCPCKLCERAIKANKVVRTCCLEKTEARNIRFIRKRIKQMDKIARNIYNNKNK